MECKIQEGKITQSANRFGKKYESCVQVDQMLQQKRKGSMQTHYAALWSVKVHM